MRTSVFYNLPESACYGCQACAQICPRQAISMITDSEGFKFPKIDTDLCIECDLCEKTCPTQENVIGPLFHATPDSVDAAWENSLEDRMESTSGGVFYALARKWINEGGIVYGVDFNDGLKVRHVRCDDINKLKRLRGSKYVQSDMAGILKEVRTDLTSGCRVLFSGTPCQVAGLRSFLKKEYENLVTIDLVCHGTPSPMIFEEHISYIEQSRKKKLSDYKFRGKSKSGWRAYIKYIFSNQDIESNPLGKDFYAYCFYNSLFNRRSCFTCGFSRSQRVGDITLSDFWNAEKKYKQLRIPRKHGFNMVMCNTSTGSEFYRRCKDELSYLNIPSDVAIQGDVRLRHPESAPDARDSYFEDFHIHGYEWLVNHRFPKPSFLSRLIPAWLKNMIYNIKSRI